MTNHYQTLGVLPNATIEQIKAAYRELAKHFHPDKHSGSDFFKRRFQEVQHAYEVLTDATKRAAFDRQYSKGNLGGGTEGKAGYEAIIAGLKAQVNELTNSLNARTLEYNTKVQELWSSVRETETLKARVTLLEASKRSSESVSKKSIAISQIKINDWFKLSLAANVAFVLCFYFIQYSQGKNTTSIAGNQYAGGSGLTTSKLNLVACYERVGTLDEAKRYKAILTLADSIIHLSPMVLIDTTHTATYLDDMKIEKADFLTARAYGKSRLENDTGAVRDCTLAILNREVLNSQPYYLRAQVKVDLGDNRGAFSDINEAARIDPKDVRVRKQRGNMYFNDKRYNEALSDYLVADQLSQNDPDVLTSIGSCYYNGNRKELACAAWRKAGNFGSQEAFNNIKNFCK